MSPQLSSAAVSDAGGGRRGGEPRRRFRRQHCHEIDAGVARKRLHDRQPLGSGERIDHPVPERETARAGRLRRQCKNGSAILHQRLVRLVCAVPLDQGELGVMQHAALAVTKRAGELHDAALARGQQLLAGEFGGRSQVEPLARIGRRDEIACKSMEMGLVSRRGHQRTGFDFDEIPGGEELPQSGGNAHAPQKKRPAVEMTSPEGRWHGAALPQPALGRAGSRENRWRMVARSVWCGPTFGPHRHRARPPGN